MATVQPAERHQDLVAELIHDVEAYNPSVDRELLSRAFGFAAAHHEGQQRRSGEDFIAHPWAVAKICAEAARSVAINLPNAVVILPAIVRTGLNATSSNPASTISDWIPLGADANAWPIPPITPATFSKAGTTIGKS